MILFQSTHPRRVRHCNLTAKSNEVREDLIAKAMTLKVEQDREDELIDIIHDAIYSENQKINLKMEFKDFEKYINMGMSAREVIGEIKNRAERIYAAENPPPMPEPEPIPEPEIPEIIPVQEPELEQQTEPIKPIVPEETETYYAVYRIVGELEELRSVSRFLKDTNFQYSVIVQGEL